MATLQSVSPPAVWEKKEVTGGCLASRLFYHHLHLRLQQQRYECDLTGVMTLISLTSPTLMVRLARSESLKAQGEGRRRGAASGAESVPRSRSDVDMEDCGEEREQPGLRPLQHSGSSSASSSSAR